MTLDAADQSLEKSHLPVSKEFEINENIKKKLSVAIDLHHAYTKLMLYGDLASYTSESDVLATIVKGINEASKKKKSFLKEACLSVGITKTVENIGSLTQEENVQVAKHLHRLYTNLDFTWGGVRTFEKGLALGVEYVSWGDLRRFGISKGMGRCVIKENLPPLLVIDTDISEGWESPTAEHEHAHAMFHSVRHSLATQSKYLEWWRPVKRKIPKKDIVSNNAITKLGKWWLETRATEELLAESLPNGYLGLLHQLNNLRNAPAYDFLNLFYDTPLMKDSQDQRAWYAVANLEYSRLLDDVGHSITRIKVGLQNVMESSLANDYFGKHRGEIDDLLPWILFQYPISEWGGLSQEVKGLHLQATLSRYRDKYKILA